VYDIEQQLHTNGAEEMSWVKKIDWHLSGLEGTSVSHS